MGGTYMTLLNTLANLGSTWPQWLVLRGIGALTVRVCVPHGGPGEAAVAAAGWLGLLPPGLTSLSAAAVGLPHGSLGGECPDAAAAGACAAAGGLCATVSDGFLCATLVSCGLGALLWLAMRRPVEALQALPRSAWLAAPLPPSKGCGTSIQSTY